MKKKIKKILPLSALVFAIGFVGAFLGKSFEKTKFGQKVENKLGIKSNESLKTAQGADCIQQQEEDKSALFVGCNGFF